MRKRMCFSTSWLIQWQLLAFFLPTCIFTASSVLESSIIFRISFIIFELIMIFLSSAFLIFFGPLPQMPCLVLLRMGFTRPACLHAAGELLPRHFTLATALPVSAVCFCCIFPVVTYGRRYLSSMPCGARTFLVRHRPTRAARDCLACPNTTIRYHASL